MPFYRFFYRAHSVKSFQRNILNFAGFSPVRRPLIGSVESSRAYREQWLNRMRSLGVKAA